MEWADIDFKVKTIAIHRAKAKSKMTRIIPMNNHVLSPLAKW
ncbi:MAG: hypothetical protein H7A00_03340 [Hahellaceae bacterium]|nr:hypothetical protein [Hahellaceae bacterium]